MSSFYDYFWLNDNKIKNNRELLLRKYIPVFSGFLCYSEN